MLDRRSASHLDRPILLDVHVRPEVVAPHIITNGCRGRTGSLPLFDGVRQMFAKRLKPQPDLPALILRIGLAAISIVHGYANAYVSHRLTPQPSLAVQTLV